MIIASFVFFRHHTYTLSSGRKGGYYEPLGAQFCNIINKHLSNRLTINHDTLTAGSVENLIKVGDDRSGFGLAQDGLPANGKIRSLLYLFESPLQIAALKEIAARGLTALKGKRVYIGAVNSGTEFIAKRVFDHYGMMENTYKRIGENWNFRQAAAALIAQHIDAAFFLVASNSEAVEMIAADERFDLINLDRAAGIARLEPSLNITQVPKGAYTCITDFPKRNVNTVATREILVCSKDVPNEIAGNVLKTILEHLPELVTKYPLTSQVSKIDPQKSFYYPLHPGALAYYEQKDVSDKITPSFILSLFSLLLTQTLAARYIPVYYRFKQIFDTLYGLDNSLSYADQNKLLRYQKRLTWRQQKLSAMYIDGLLTKEYYERLNKYAEMLLMHCQYLINQIQENGSRVTL